MNCHPVLTPIAPSFESSNSHLVSSSLWLANKQVGYITHANAQSSRLAFSIVLPTFPVNILSFNSTEKFPCFLFSNLVIKLSTDVITKINNRTTLKYKEEIIT